MPLADVWRSATTISGGQCVMISGVFKMPKWHVDSWDSPQQVCNEVIIVSKESLNQSIFLVASL